MQKKQIGNVVVIGLAALNVLLWFIFQPSNAATPNTAGQFYGEMLAATAMVLMAVSLVLSTKPRRLEPYFGGLDKMYQTHKQAAILAFFLLIGHRMVIPLAESTFLSKRLGNVAYLGIIFLVLITIAPRIPLISRILNPPYHRWRALHRLLGLLFIVGLVHSLLVTAVIQQTVPGGYMLIVSLTGAVAWLYHITFGSRRHRLAYTVTAVESLNGACCELTLKPQGNKLAYEAGQFAFVHFEGERQLAEPHPFTISSAPDEPNLRLSIKGSGDWTRYLRQNLKAGTTAQIDGAYGRFNYKTGGEKQVWVAGGIGVTPFLSWIRAANGSLGADIDFFYGVRGEGDALFWDEINAEAAKRGNLRAHLQYSVKDGHLSAEDVAQRVQGNIADRDIYLCGPIKMTEGFTRAFRKMGVPASNIHFEEFNFR